MSAALGEAEAKQARDLIQKLDKISTIGHEVIETIELELSTGTDEHVLDRVIRMLQELEAQLKE
jgi:hypothetical protein